MLSNVTAIIKTINRPLHLNHLITTIKKYYPDLKIMVADDSKDPKIRTDVEYYTMPYDSGVSAGRNFLLDKLKTKYFLLLDDDFYFTEKTKIERLKELLEKHDLDIMGGAVSECGNIMDYYGRLVKDGDTVSYTRDVTDKGDYTEADIIPFFFLAKNNVRWDPFFKTSEHFDFFYSIKGKRKIGYTKEVIVEHRHDLFGEPGSYIDLRYNRRKDFFPYMLEKHGLKKLIAFNETICL